MPPRLSPRESPRSSARAQNPAGLTKDGRTLAGRRIRDLLERHGVDLAYREYRMGHQVSAEEMGDVSG